MPPFTPTVPLSGDLNAREASELLPLVYEDLRKLAAARLALESAGQTLQPTALVHEAYIRIAGAESAARWDNAGHFFAAAAEAMRRILIDNARRKQSLRKGGGLSKVDLDLDCIVEFDQTDRILAIDDAIQKLAAIDSRAADVVRLRFFAGLTITEVATVLKISSRTANADWAYARAWLIDTLGVEE